MRPKTFFMLSIIEQILIQECSIKKMSHFVHFIRTHATFSSLFFLKEERIGFWKVTIKRLNARGYKCQDNLFCILGEKLL